MADDPKNDPRYLALVDGYGNDRLRVQMVHYLTAVIRLEAAMQTAILINVAAVDTFGVVQSLFLESLTSGRKLSLLKRLFKDVVVDPPTPDLAVRIKTALDLRNQIAHVEPSFKWDSDAGIVFGDPSSSPDMTVADLRKRTKDVERLENELRLAAWNMAASRDIWGEFRPMVERTRDSAEEAVRALDV